MAENPTIEKAVIRGLEGVVAAETSISYVDGTHGRLYYQGYDIHDIAEEISFAECVFLLWNGRLPTRDELNQIRADIVKEMRLSNDIITVLKSIPPGTHPMAALRMGVDALAAYDPDADDISFEGNKRKAKRLIGQIPAVISALQRLRAGLDVIQPDPDLGVSANMIYMMRGDKPDKLEQEAMDCLMVLHADHGLNASTFTARVITATLSDMHSALSGAIGALKGPLHGGANQKVMEMLLEIDHVDMVQDYIEGMLNNKQRIMGFGHRVYQVEDPRAKHLRCYSELLCEKTDQQHLYEISHRIEMIVREAKGIYPNVDFYSATVQHALGISPEYFTTLFAASRTSGWIAHIFEQYADNRLIRPTSKYIGELGLPFIPLDQRKAE